MIPFLVVVFTSCRKNPGAVVDPALPFYRITKESEFDDNGNVVNAATFTYSNNQLKRSDIVANMLGSTLLFNYTYEYQGDRILKQNLFINSANSDDYDTILYNGDGTYQKIERYTRTNNGFVLYARFTFTCMDSKLSQFTRTSIQNGTANILEEYDFAYTGENITTLVTKEFSPNGNAMKTYTLEYDSNPNYYNRISRQPLLQDIAFEDWDEFSIAAATSANNITSITQGGSPISSFTYILDGNKNVTEVMINGKEKLKYEIETYYTF